MAEQHRMSQEQQLGVECASRELAAARDAEGRLWVAWISHVNELDTVMTRPFHGREPGPLASVSTAPGRYLNPVVLALSDGLVFLWRSHAAGRWCLLSRRLQGGRWDDDVTLCPGVADVSAFAAAVEPNGEVLVAAVAEYPDGRELRWAHLTGAGWSSSETIVAGNDPLGRPTLSIAADGAAWLAWDVYQDRSYCVYACRRRHGRFEAPAPVSRGPHWQLLPTIAAGPGGAACLAWLVSQRVRDQHGVLDHLAWLAAARFDGERWLPLGDAAALGPVPGTVECLGQGLLADNNYMGYYGRRRHPQIVAADGGYWLLWERKLSEDFDTANWGALCARRHDGDAWGKTVELHRGGLCYQAAAAAPLAFAYKGDPREHSPIGHADILAATAAADPWPAPDAWPPRTWQRWSAEPARVAAPSGERPTLMHRGRRLQLFWGDLHCHSFQSPDAEGEIDELLHYARDVAGLDFCALADNDWYPNNILTAGMWEEIGSVTERFTETGRFLAFPGFEWTYHGPPTDRWNHRIVHYQAAGGPAIRRVEPAGKNVDAFVRSLCRTDALAHAHHKSWSVICEAFDRNVEVCSGWQVHSGDLSEVMVHLAAGHRFGFAGSSDGHRYVPGHGGGLVGVWAEALTPAAVFAALRVRRNYATTGSRVVIRFGVCGYFMGEEGALVEQPRLSHGWSGWHDETEPGRRPRVAAEIEAPADIAGVDVYRDGAPVYTAEAGGQRKLSFDWLDENALPGTHYYHLRVRLRGETAVLPHNSAPAAGNLAWSSPVWVRVG